MIPGTNIPIGTRTWLVPPLNFAALKKHRAFLIRAMRGEIDPANMGEEDFETMLDLVYLALKRNYPAVTEAEIAEALDLGNVGTVMPALMRTSGFENAETQPGQAPGK